MELFLSEEKIPAPDHWSQQSSQTLFTPGYKYRCGTLYDNTRSAPGVENTTPADQRWSVSLEVPKPIQAIHGDRNDGHYYEQTHTSMKGPDRDTVMKWSHEWMNDKLADFQLMERVWLARIDAMPVLPGDYIHPKLDNDKTLIWGELLSGGGDKVPVLLTPRQFMASIHSYHNPEFDARAADPEWKALHNRQFQLLNASIVHVDTGHMSKMTCYKDMQVNRVQYRFNGDYDVAFRQAEFGMTKAATAEYRNGLLAAQSATHDAPRLYVVEKPNGYSPTGWQAVRHAMCTSEKQAVEHLFNAVPESFGGAMAMIGLRRLVQADQIQDSGNVHGERYAANPRVVPVDLRPAGGFSFGVAPELGPGSFAKLSAVEAGLIDNKGAGVTAGPAIW